MATKCQTVECTVVKECIFTWVRDARAAIFPVAAGTHTPSEDNTPPSGRSGLLHSFYFQCQSIIRSP